MGSSAPALGAPERVDMFTRTGCHRSFVRSLVLEKQLAWSGMTWDGHLHDRWDPIGLFSRERPCFGSQGTHSCNSS